MDLLPAINIREQLGKLLAADPTTLAPVALANHIALVKAAFTPSETLLVADLTLADFTGSTPLSAGIGTQPEGLDPNTGEQIITIKAPAGGWRWETTALANLPQTIFGIVLMDNADAVLLGTALFANPETLTIVNQAIDLGNVELRILATPFSG